MSTTFDLRATERFPETTSISAYPASNWPVTSTPPSGAAVGSATASATMTSGVAAFTGLADDTVYFFGASVGGTWRYVRGRTTPAVPDVATQAELDAGLATKEGLLTPTAVKSGSYTAAAGDLVPVDATAASRTITLPTAPANGSGVAVKMIAVGAGFTTSIVCGGSDVFNKTGGGTTLTLTLVNQAAVLQYASGIWYVVADDLTLGGLDARFTPLAKLQPTDFSDANVPVWDATAGKFVAEPRGAIKRVVNTTGGLTVANTANSYANRLQWVTAGAVKPFDDFGFTMPNYTVEVEFWSPHVFNATPDKHTFVVIEKNDGSQSSPGFVTAVAQGGATANIGNALSARCLLEPGVDYAVGAAVSLRLSGFGPATTGQMTIASPTSYGKSWLVARRSSSLA